MLLLGMVTARAWVPSVAPVVEVATAFEPFAVHPSVSVSHEKIGAAEHTGAASAATRRLSRIWGFMVSWVKGEK
jgi:hypothetical protein